LNIYIYIFKIIKASTNRHKKKTETRVIYIHHCLRYRLKIVFCYAYESLREKDNREEYYHLRLTTKKRRRRRREE
jgi:hypothetical protein